MRSTQPILNSAYLGAAMLAVSGVFSGYGCSATRARRAPYEVGLAGRVHVLGRHVVVHRRRERDRPLLRESVLGSALVYTSITAALLTWLGIRKQWPLPRWIALFLPAVAGLYAFAHAQPFGHPFARWGAVGWLGDFRHAFRTAADLGAGAARARSNGCTAAACWVLALLIAWELNWQVASARPECGRASPWGFVPALVLAWFGLRELRPDWPVAQHA